MVVGNSANWMEAAETLTQLAELHRIQMNEPVYFNEPYVGLDEMPSVVDRTFRSARSKPALLLYTHCFSFSLSVQLKPKLHLCDLLWICPTTCCKLCPVKK